MEYSVCVPAVFNHMKTQDALPLIAGAGAKAYEFWSWWDQDLDAVLRAQQENGLHCVALCTKSGSLTDSSKRGEYLDGLRETLAVAQKLGCGRIISQVGNDLKGVPAPEQHQSIVDGLRACIPLLRGTDILLMIEPLNTRIDHKGYYLWSSREAFEIAEEVSDPQIKVLYDLYHQYVMDDLSVPDIVAHLPEIGHFHAAGFPGRHNPFVPNDMDYPTILRAIRDAGYQGAVGLEYFPTEDPYEGLTMALKQIAKL